MKLKISIMMATTLFSISAFSNCFSLWKPRILPRECTKDFSNAKYLDEIITGKSYAISCFGDVSHNNERQWRQSRVRENSSREEVRRTLTQQTNLTINELGIALEKLADQDKICNSKKFYKIETIAKIINEELVRNPGLTTKVDIPQETILPCGLIGSINERIINCSNQKNSTVNGYKLVSRSKELKTIYQEVSTKLLWSDTHDSKMNQAQAEEYCSIILQDNLENLNLSWRLPTINEYLDASKVSQINESLTRDKYSFWSSSKMISLDKEWGIAFYGSSSSTEFGYFDIENESSVKCVAELKE